MRTLVIRSVLLWVLAASTLGLLYADSQRINSNLLFCQKAGYEMFFNPQLGHWDARFTGCERY